MSESKIAVIGTVGVPANYGGFETLAENLVRYHLASNLLSELAVYCSSKSYTQKLESYFGAELRYINLNANGVSSILYDIVSLFSAVRKGVDVILLLGVSGAVALPFVRLLSRSRIVTNIDGIEWKREKWKGLPKWFLRFSEYVAVRFSHEVIADNGGIAKHVFDNYGRRCHVIAYGGDHALLANPTPYSDRPLPSQYALSLCRIEPENNVVMILEAFADKADSSLVFVGNWNNSAYGQSLLQRYGSFLNLHLLDSIYDIGVLSTIRGKAAFYIHGHSAGGTNPSLVEMMHFGKPVLAYDCIFNRFTTSEKALFFKTSDELRCVVDRLTPDLSESVGAEMQRIANERYTWDLIGKQYFEILSS
jgi:glycosyltransferase involved in cell wall biosynthesis